jgi:hypothetical protein
MKYATVEDIVAIFPHPILPKVQGETDYQTIHTIRKLLQANTRSIDTHSGVGALEQLVIIVSDSEYAIIASHQQAKMDQYFRPTQHPHGVHRQFWTREW